MNFHLCFCYGRGGIFDLSEKELTALRERAKTEKTILGWDDRSAETIFLEFTRKSLEYKTVPFDEEGCKGPDEVPNCKSCNGVDTMKALFQDMEKGKVFWGCKQCCKTEDYPIPK